MSGGVDSSVAAALLVQQGHEVIGATMKLFCYGDDVPDRPCCSLDSIMDAQRGRPQTGHPALRPESRGPLRRLGHPQFRGRVRQGRTPIPCVRCNSFTKFRDLLAHADALGCDAIATGHYAIARDGALFRGSDRQKDQSYFLWGIDRGVVARMLTPVGESTKAETRAIARQLAPMTADKKESVEICFVPDGDYVGVLESRLPADAPALAPGPLVTTSGEVVGEHQGFARYTVGQRRGLPGGQRRAPVCGADPAGIARSRGGDREGSRRPAGPARGGQLARRAAGSRRPLRGAGAVSLDRDPGAGDIESTTARFPSRSTPRPAPSPRASPASCIDGDRVLGGGVIA